MKAHKLKKEARDKRIFDCKTMTYGYSDGSGLIIQEQVIGRELLYNKILMIEGGLIQSSPCELAGLKFKHLTYFSDDTTKTKRRDF